MEAFCVPHFGAGPPIKIRQDAFENEKGQKSAISGRRLHWILQQNITPDFPQSWEEPPMDQYQCRGKL